jgi:hypothetical protein
VAMNEQLVLSVVNEKLDEKIKSEDLIFWSTYRPNSTIIIKSFKNVFLFFFTSILFGFATFAAFSEEGINTHNVHPFVKIFAPIMPFAAPLLFLFAVMMLIGQVFRLIFLVIDMISAKKYNSFIAVTKDFILLNEHGSVSKISISDIVKIELNGDEIHYTRKDNVKCGLEASYMKEPLNFIDKIRDMI